MRDRTTLYQNYISTQSGGPAPTIQADVEIRMDASLMTSDMELGCVLQISNVKNPISVVHKILENPLH